MATIVIDGDRLIRLLVDDTRICCRAAAYELSDVASPIGAHIFIIFCIAGIPGFVGPCRAILQPHIDRAAIVHDTMEIGVGCRQSHIDMGSREGKDIPIQLYLLCAGGGTCCAGIHVNGALVSSQSIVPVVSARRYMDRAASDRYFASCCIDRDAIAIDIHVRQAFDLDLTILDTGQDSRIIETGIYIFWI